jgi:hypothetical protein
MNSLPLLLAPLALLLPAAAELRAVEQPDDMPRGEAAGAKVSLLGPSAPAVVGFPVLEDARQTPVQRQVRIQQRVIIRIAPSSPQARDRLMAEMPRRPRGSYEEEKLDGCVPINSIAGVVPSTEDNRLLLFMRDRRVLSAALERSCRAQDYYLGFYIERSQDGQLCARRDKLQSRAGASCEVAQLNRLVSARD